MKWKRGTTITSMDGILTPSGDMRWACGRTKAAIWDESPTDAALAPTVLIAVARLIVAALLATVFVAVARAMTDAEPTPAWSVADGVEDACCVAPC
jgi:hypothetical protein